MGTELTPFYENEQWVMACDCGWTYRNAYEDDVLAEIERHLAGHPRDYQAALVDILTEFRSFVAQTKPTDDTCGCSGFRDAAEVGLVMVQQILARHNITDLSET